MIGVIELRYSVVKYHRMECGGTGGDNNRMPYDVGASCTVVDDHHMTCGG